MFRLKLIHRGTPVRKFPADCVTEGVRHAEDHLVHALKAQELDPPGAASPQAQVLHQLGVQPDRLAARAFSPSGVAPRR